MKKFDNIAAAILAGGKNLRMSGLNKAFIKIDGLPIVQRQIGLLQGIFRQVILVTNSPEVFKLYAKETVIIEDIYKDAGPLAGIHSALSQTSKEAVFFVACDMPFLHNDIIARQLDYFERIECDCLVPRINNSIEPLHAVYKKELKDSIQDFLEYGNNRSIKSFLKTVNVRYLDLDTIDLGNKIFTNINTPQDLRRVEDYESKVQGLV